MPLTAHPLPLCVQGHPQAEPEARFCGQCGSPVLPGALAGAPACALHPNVRAEQPCARCGNFACRACLRAAPDGSSICVACESRAAALELPWDARHQRGTISSFVRTCAAIISHPAQTLDRARPEGSVGSSLYFSVLADTTTYLTTFLVYGAVALAFLGTYLFGAQPGERTLTPLTSVGITAGAVVAVIAVFLISALGGTLLGTALDHLVLKLVGANPRSFEVTLRARALSAAPCLVGLIPFCGPYVVPVWALVLRVFAYRGLHRISTGKAVAGALAVPGVLMFLALAGYVVALLLAVAGGKL